MTPKTAEADRTAPVRDADFTTISGRELKNVYTADDLAPEDLGENLGLPGDYPYTRGIHPTMYRGKLWTMRQFAGMGTAEQTNQRFKFLLERGQTGLSTAFDNPTLYGWDSDHPLSAGEVGKTGVAVDSLADMERLFDSIPLDKVSTSMTINAPAAWIFTMFLANAENRGVPLEKLRGTIQNDILKEYIAQKEWIFPPEPHIRLICDMFAFCADHVPQWNTISISGYHIREAGATAAQELAFTLMDGFTYVDAAIEAGMNVDDFAPRLSFFFNSHMDFFEEIAKLRAARRIWARHMKEEYGAQNPRSWLCRFHVQTAGCSLTAQQPEVNIVRTAIEALAGVLGGCQSLHTNSMDEALALPSDKAVEIALRTQQVIAFESGVANVADPLGGSYLIERLTRELEEEAESYFAKIREMGGMVKAIERGFPQQEITRSAYEYQCALSEKRKTMVGVNEFVHENEVLEIPILEIGESVERDQIAAVKKLKETRDNVAVKDSLDALEKAARTKENLIPHLLRCSHAYATEGEITETLIKVFGEYREQAFF
ncbi:MAG: methylmalonyl-CoA mutase family protein [Armatimonadetes bacterium]|nr:methylmalonyl-CoA mutase [Armatimonadota bacterium]NOG93094.1 methylmalonyl-CoA mutase family protein [Armatimonadota bacterium]